MSKNFSTEAKVGIFVLLGIVALAYMSLKVGEIRIGKEKGYRLRVQFTNAGGLQRDAAVRVAGVRVGKVVKIFLKDSKAHLTLLINNKVFLEKDARAMIKTSGILGDKYVEILPGVAEDYLVDGDEIIKTLSPADLDSLMNKVTVIADDIKQVTGSLRHSIGTKESYEDIRQILVSVRDTTSLMREVINRNDEKIERFFTDLESISGNIDDLVRQNDEKVSRFFTNFQEVSDSLNDLIKNNNDNVSAIVANLKGFSGDLKDISDANKESLNDVISNLQSFSNSLSEKTPEIFAQLKEISNNINRIVQENKPGLKEGIRNINTASVRLKDTLNSLKNVTKKIDEGDGTVGKLINEDTTYNKLNDTLAGINKYLIKADQFKTIVDFRSEYMSEADAFKHYLTLRFQPNQDKYYFVEIIDDPAGEVTTTDRYITTQVGDEPAQTTVTHEEVVEDKFKLSIGIAKRYYDMVIRGGIIESSGGFGLDYNLFDDNLKLSVDAYDFNNNDNIHMKAYAQLNLMKHLIVTAGYDDFVKRDTDPSYFFGAGFTFTDDDLKYLLTSVPLSSR